MKKIILLSTFLIICFQSYSQYKGGLELGGNLMNADFYMGEELQTTPTYGIRLGYIGEYHLFEDVFLRFGLLVNQRGFELADERWGLNVFDAPLNVGYALKLNNNLKLTLDGGFNIEYNFQAFTKIDGKPVKISIGRGEDDIKQIGAGVNLGIGLQLSEFIKVRGEYYKGLSNLVRTQGDDWKNRVIGLSVDFFFGSRD